MSRWMMALAMVGLLVVAFGRSNQAVEAAPRSGGRTTEALQATPASDCQAMLASDFLWANKPDQNGSPATQYQVWATLTIQSPKTIVSRDVYAARSDQVWYIWGELNAIGTGDQQVLKGTFVGRASPLFEEGNMDFEVSISKTGTVSVQQKIDGLNWLGRGPEVFQATCNGGLMTGVVNQTQGLRSHVLSLTQTDLSY